MIDDELKAIRARCNAATPPPWEVGEDGQEDAATLRAQPIFAVTGIPYGDPVDVIIPFGRAYSDARFCATARTDMPRLLDEVERLRRQVSPMSQDAQTMRQDTQTKVDYSNLTDEDLATARMFVPIGYPHLLGLIDGMVAEIKRYRRANPREDIQESVSESKHVSLEEGLLDSRVQDGTHVILASSIGIHIRCVSGYYLESRKIKGDIVLQGNRTTRRSLSGIWEAWHPCADDFGTLCQVIPDHEAD